MARVYGSLGVTPAPRPEFLWVGRFQRASFLKFQGQFFKGYFMSDVFTISYNNSFGVADVVKKSEGAMRKHLEREQSDWTSFFAALRNSEKYKGVNRFHHQQALIEQEVFAFCSVG
jgi:hypothetical protein